MNWKQINKIPNFEISESGEVRNKTTKVLAKKYIQKLGFQIRIKDQNKYYYKMINVLMAETFIINHDKKHEVIRIDGNMYNDKLTNLVSQKRTKRNKGPEMYKREKVNKVWLNEIRQKEKEYLSKILKN